MAVTDNLVLSENKHVKGTSPNWFETEIMKKKKKKKSRERKCILKFKTFCLHTDKYFCKEVRNEVQKLICKKKKIYFHRKLTENTGTPEELWKGLKSSGLKF